MALVLDQALSGVSLGALTTWGIGGVAESLFCPSNLTQLSTYLSRHVCAQAPLFWLGLGSNVLIADEGLKGHVILTHHGLSELTWLDTQVLYAQAGVPCAKIARFCAQRGLAQAAFLAGIPGTLGGALAMNAGAWGGETWQLVEALQTIDHAGTIRWRPVEAFTVGYRSVQGPRGEWFVGARLRSMAGGPMHPLDTIRTLLKSRAATQPIGTRNCGSVFLNPPGGSAGAFIEQAGLKGTREGGLIISPKHANFIVNLGGGTARQALTLMRLIQEEVARRFQVRLRTEVRLMGLEPEHLEQMEASDESPRTARPR